MTNQQQIDQPKDNKGLCTNKTCYCCDFHGNYTHEFPLLLQMHLLWEAQVEARGQKTTSSAPPNTSLAQFTMFSNPFP